MTPEELLQPRWKVIADFPKSSYNIGQILIPFSIKDEGLQKWYIQDDYDYSWIRVEDYPAIFKKLEWWEERDVQDLPQYIKLNNSGDIYKVIEYNEYFFIIEINKNRTSSHWPLSYLRIVTPVTEEEYKKNKQINPMKKLLLILPILFYHCSPTCEQYYLYSPQQRFELTQIDPNYVDKTVNDSVYTKVVESKAAFEIYKQGYPDTKIAVIGCPQDVILK